MKSREAFGHCVEKIRDNIGRNLFKGDWDLNEKKSFHVKCLIKLNVNSGASAACDGMEK